MHVFAIILGRMTDAVIKTNGCHGIHRRGPCGPTLRYQRRTTSASSWPSTKIILSQRRRNVCLLYQTHHSAPGRRPHRRGGRVVRHALASTPRALHDERSTPTSWTTRSVLAQGQARDLGRGRGRQRIPGRRRMLSRWQRSCSDGRYREWTGRRRAGPEREGGNNRPP